MWLFLADGCLSVADELLRNLSGDEALVPLRVMLAFVVVSLSFVVYAALAFDRRLPKLILLPQSLFALWGMTALWPLPLLFESFNSGVLVASLQVSLGLLPFFVLRSPGRWRSLLPREHFTVPGFSLKNLLFMGLASLFILPLLLILFACSGSISALENATGGFLQVKADGIYMQERIYRQAGSTVHLTSMIHIGDKTYYDQFVASLPIAHSIVLAEGVSDEEGLLTSRFGYAKMAGLLGLTSQQQLRFPGELLEPADLDRLAANDHSAGLKILRADVDLREFAPLTIEFLNVLGRELLAGEDLASGLQAYNTWVNANMNEESYADLMDDVLRKRNAALLGYLDRVRDHYDTIIIPWGALHMPGIEQGLLKRGFRLQEVKLRRSIDFSSVDLPGIARALLG